MDVVSTRPIQSMTHQIENPFCNKLHELLYYILIICILQPEQIIKFKLPL